MFRTSGFTLRALPWLAATAMICAAVALGPDAARAQAAGDVKCKKCVDTRDIARQAIKKSRIKKGAVDTSRLSTDLQQHVEGRGAYYIELDGDGATATIATHGPLRYFARCRVNQPDGMGGFEDRIEIVATSSVSGWFEEDESDDSSGNAPLNAGQEVIADTETISPPGTPSYGFPGETSAVAPDGSYLALKGDSGGNGQNIFGHDCVVAGTIYRVTGTP